MADGRNVNLLPFFYAAYVLSVGLLPRVTLLWAGVSYTAAKYDTSD